jgi:YggT family protein
MVILVFLVRAIFSWILVFGVRNQFVLRANLMLGSITEPIITPLRRYIPSIGGLDLSYMLAVLLLVLIREILLRI